MYSGPPRQPITREEYLRRHLAEVPICIDGARIVGTGIAPTREEYLRSHLFAIRDSTPTCSQAQTLPHGEVCDECGFSIHEL